MIVHPICALILVYSKWDNCNHHKDMCLLMLKNLIQSPYCKLYYIFGALNLLY